MAAGSNVWEGETGGVQSGHAQESMTCQSVEMSSEEWPSLLGNQRSVATRLTNHSATQSRTLLGS